MAATVEVPLSDIMAGDFLDAHGWAPVDLLEHFDPSTLETLAGVAATWQAAMTGKRGRGHCGWKGGKHHGRGSRWGPLQGGPFGAHHHGHGHPPHCPPPGSPAAAPPSVVDSDHPHHPPGPPYHGPHGHHGRHGHGHGHPAWHGFPGWQSDSDGPCGRWKRQCRGRGRWAPVHVVEKEAAYEVLLEAPGLTREELKVEFKEGELVVSGDKPEEQVEGRLIHQERATKSTFSRSFQLPSDVEPQGIKAHYENGLLRVSVPKKSQAATQQFSIPIAGGSDSAGPSNYHSELQPPQVEEPMSPDGGVAAGDVFGAQGVVEEDGMVEEWEDVAVHEQRRKAKGKDVLEPADVEEQLEKMNVSSK